MATTQSTCNRGSLAPNQSERNRLNAIKCIGDYICEEWVQKRSLGEANTAHLVMIMREVAACNLEFALEAVSLDFIKDLPASELCPHPLIVARAEIANAIRYWR